MVCFQNIYTINGGQFIAQVSYFLLYQEIEPQNKLIVFQGKEIRRAWHNNEWYYSLVDIVGVLTDSANPTDYLKKIRKRDPEVGSYIGTNCPQVDMSTKTGKKRKTIAGNTKDTFRLIQSIPSKKAEPFKLMKQGM